AAHRMAAEAPRTAGSRPDGPDALARGGHPIRMRPADPVTRHLTGRPSAAPHPPEGRANRAPAPPPAPTPGYGPRAAGPSRHPEDGPRPGPSAEPPSATTHPRSEERRVGNGCRQPGGEDQYSRTERDT